MSRHHEPPPGRPANHLPSAAIPLSLELTRVLGRVLGRPTILPLPAAAVRLLMGDMGEALLLASTRVQPRRLERAGFRFRHPDLEGALRAALRPRTAPALLRSAPVEGRGCERA